MTRAIVAAVICGVLLTACSRPRPTTMRDLTFVTRGECANSPKMRANLDAALLALGLSGDFVVLDLDTVARTDARSGYPTPTVLYRNRDVFGMAEPPPPYPEPS